MSSQALLYGIRTPLTEYINIHNKNSQLTYAPKSDTLSVITHLGKHFSPPLSQWAVLDDSRNTKLNLPGN